MQPWKPRKTLRASLKTALHRVTRWFTLVIHKFLSLPYLKLVTTEGSGFFTKDLEIMIPFHLDYDSGKWFTMHTKVNCLSFVPRLAQAAAANRILPTFIMQKLLVQERWAQLILSKLFRSYWGRRADPRRGSRGGTTIINPITKADLLPSKAWGWLPLSSVIIKTLMPYYYCNFRDMFG